MSDRLMVHRRPAEQQPKKVTSQAHEQTKRRALFDAAKSVAHTVSTLPRKAKLAVAAGVIIGAAGTAGAAGVEPFKTIDNAAAGAAQAGLTATGDFLGWNAADKAIEVQKGIPPANFASDGSIYVMGNAVDALHVSTFGGASVIPGSEGYLVRYPALNTINGKEPQMVVLVKDKDGKESYVSIPCGDPTADVGTGNGIAIIAKKASTVGSINHADGTISVNTVTGENPGILAGLMARDLSQATVDNNPPPAPQP